MIKKIISLFLILGTSTLCAKPIASGTAKKVAQNFYRQNSKTDVNSVDLSYTGLTASGKPAYYAFNINTNAGFVIVSADDAASPIIGYSTTSNFVVPEAYTTIAHWLAIRAKEIDNIQNLNLIPSADIALDWTKYVTNNSTINQKRVNGNANTMSVGAQPLVQSTWNQSPNYNALCPGGSVTGCVATAMAQIMRYWNYPATGTGSSSYCDCSSQGFSNNYGTLSANYGATTYNWSNMPLGLNTHNTDVATLNYHCGVSVNMDYAPAGSGAWVIASDNPICAQNSYVTYFGYDPITIQGLNRSDYTDSSWTVLLKNDIDIGRPIQYVGDDPAEGGHTWVCDAYDQNDFFHMNWGWGGSDNGYFLLNNLQTTNGSFNPSVGHEAVIGIVPMALNAIDAGIPAINAPTGYYCGNNLQFTPTFKLQNYGSNALTSCIINYQIDNGIVLTQNWSGSLIFGQSTIINLPTYVATVGSHTLVCYSSAPNSSIDQNLVNDKSVVYYTITSDASLPVVEGFESTLLPSSTWNVSHSSANGIDFSVTTNAAATGVKSAMIDNMNNTAGNNSFLQTSFSYDLSTLSSPALSFKVAYQKKTSANNDRLQVYTSDDCGASWQSRWARTGSVLSSGIGTNPYIAAQADFTTYTVNINAVSAKTNVLFRWEFFADLNGAGNNLYIDDINIINSPQAAGIQNIETTVSLSLYPNPSSGVVNTTFNFTEKHTVSIQVTDMLGRVIESVNPKLYQAGEATIVLGSSNAYQTGVYLTNINIDGQQVSKKIIIE
jgi:hypothetical protein